MVTYSPRTGRARDGDVTLVGNRVVESYVEQAIFSTPGIDAGVQARLRRLRRNIDREREAAVEKYRTLPNAGRRAGAAGRDAGAAARPPGADAARDADDDHAGRGADAAARGDRAPLTSPAAACRSRRHRRSATDGCCTPRSTRSSGAWAATFAEWEGWDWISDFGDPIAEHHAVREAVGIWDESPLRKWFFKGPDALAAADYCFTCDMAALEVGQCRYGPFCDERGQDARRRRRLRGETETACWS